MKSYTENLTAGIALNLAVQGRVLYIKESSAGEVLTVELVRNRAESDKIEQVGKGFKTMPVLGFDGVKITPSVNTVVQFIVTDGNIDFKFDDEIIVGNADADPVPVKTPAGTSLSVTSGAPLEVTNPAGQRLDVNIDGGTVTVTADNVGINNDNAGAVPVKKQALSTIVHQAAVAVGVAATALVSDATLRKLVIRNDHATAKIALGGAGVTLANGAIVLMPGDMWVEEDAAGAAWYAISDTAATNVQVTGIK